MHKSMRGNLWTWRLQRLLRHQYLVAAIVIAVLSNVAGAVVAAGF